MAKKKTRLAFPKNSYNPHDLAQLDKAQVRREYQRLRRVANQRLSRFEGTEWVESEVYKRNAGYYVPLTKIESDAQLRYRLSALARFITADTGSITGLERARREAISTLHGRGYKFINKSNFHQFTSFMEEFREQKLSELYDSERTLELFQTAEKKGIPPEDLYNNFVEWIQNTDKLKKLKKPKSSKQTNSDYYRRKLKIKK